MTTEDPPDVSTFVLRTDRLVLRWLTEDDVEFILELLNEPSFLENIGDKGVRNADDARRYLASGPVASYEQNGFGLYRVELAASAEPIGMCGLVRREGLEWPDVGFAFLPRFWSRGYASEAAAVVMADGRERLGLTRLLAITSPDNVGSQRVLEKVGFQFERLTRLTPDDSEVSLFSSKSS